MGLSAVCDCGSSGSYSLFMKSMQLQICHLQITFANSLDQHNFQSHLEPKMFDTQMVFLIIIIFFFLKNKTEDDNNKMKNYPTCKELTYLSLITNSNQQQF